MDPVRLSKLIIDRITELGTVTYDELLARAMEKNIDQGIFENAVQRLHKSRTVLVKNIKGELTYSIKPVEVKKTGFEIVDEWRKANPYPYPVLCQQCQGKLCAACFPFYDSERDTIEKIRESLYMTRDEYKAKS